MNKTKTYIILTAVLGILGTIGFKIIKGIDSDTTNVPQQEFSVVFNPKLNTKTDTFSIQKVIKDPFLGTLASNNKSDKPKNKSKVKPITDSPNITYSGLVKKQNAYNPVFVVAINNKQHLLKQGQVVDSVTLVKGDIKTITVRYKNKSLTIKRN